MLILLYSLFAINHCVVGAGPAGITMTWQLLKAFPNHNIVIIDPHFDGGTLSHVKEECSNLGYESYVSYAKQMGVTHLPFYESFQECGDGLIEPPKLECFVNLINDILEYMNQNGLITKIKAQVTRINMIYKNGPFKLNYDGESDNLNCDYIFLAMGGKPKEFLIENVVPRQFNMYDSLKLLNNEVAKKKSELNGKTAYLVGNGDTARWIKKKLKILGISYTLVVKEDGGYMDNRIDYKPEFIINENDFKFKVFSENDVIFYAHGQDLAKIPIIYYKNQPFNPVIKEHQNMHMDRYFTVGESNFMKSYKIYEIGSMANAVTATEIARTASVIITKMKKQRIRLRFRINK
eukprot:NODE_143_length_15882_cov_1.296585.p4 type:complete len:349 gc:universal NODE_143_length_15882_cov_1.296585:5836-6882(+)